MTSESTDIPSTTYEHYPWYSWSTDVKWKLADTENRAFKCKCGKQGTVRVLLEGKSLSMEIRMCEECWEKIEKEVFGALATHLLSSGGEDASEET